MLDTTSTFGPADEPRSGTGPDIPWDSGSGFDVAPGGTAPVFTAADAAIITDPRYVQFAALIGCDIPGCTEFAVPDAWALVDLDTGTELPGRYCEHHQSVYATRPRLIVVP